MHLIVGFSLGTAAGIMLGALLRNGTFAKTDANKQVDNLNAQAQKNLQKLQQNQKQIAQVSQKAQTAQQDLNSKITELANQE